VIVWLWDANGPARTARGVTDDEARARAGAEAFVRSGHANVARVERALARLGIESLTSDYVRMGDGWIVEHHRDGRIAWMPFAAPLSEMAAS
jgi:hypothetical protein